MQERPRIQHVSIPRPPESARETRYFYGDLLELEEVRPPDSLQHHDLIWYRVGASELHLFVAELTDDGSGRHLCLEVDNLDQLRARLEAAGYAPWEPTPIPGRPRFFCRDPFDNIIEFTTIQGDYLAATS